MPIITRLWPAWVAVVLAATARLLLWHLEYFRRPGPQFLWLYLGGLAGLGVFAWFYLRRRERWLAREARLLVLFFLALFLAQAPMATLYALGILLVCFSVGRLLLAGVAETPLEQLTLWTAAGLGALSAGMFLLGLTRLYYRWLVLALLAVAVAACWRNARRIWSLWLALERSYAAAARGPLWGLCLLFVAASSLSSVMVVLSPETAFDPVSFHFVYSRQYALRHGLEAMDRLPYSYFPQNVEILYTLGFLLEGQATAKILTYAFFPLAAMAVVLIGRRWFSAPGALVGAALFVTTPFLSWTGSVAKNDLALACYLLLAVYAVMRWREGNQFRWLAAGTLFVGLSFSVKHVAVLGALPLAGIAVWHLRRVRLTARQAGLLVAIFAASGLYWHTRTFLLKGNPVYPEFGASAMRSTTAAGHPELSRLERLGVYLSTPWTVHYRGWRHFESPSPSPAGVFLIAFLLVVGGGIRNRPAFLLVVYVLLYFQYWAAVVIQLRFAIAAFGVLYAFLGDRMAAFEPRRRISTLALAAWCFVLALTLTLILEVNVPRVKLFTRQISPDQYLRDSLMTYRSIEAVNHDAGPGDVVYAVGNCSTFYSKPEFHCYYDAGGNYSLERIAADLRESRYGFLIVANHWAEPAHMRVIEHLYRTELIHDDGRFRAYRVERKW